MQGFFSLNKYSLFKQWSVSVKEVWADSAPGNLMFLKQMFAQEAKLQAQIY